MTLHVRATRAHQMHLSLMFPLARWWHNVYFPSNTQRGDYPVWNDDFKMLVLAL